MRPLCAAYSVVCTLATMPSLLPLRRSQRADAAARVGPSSECSCAQHVGLFHQILSGGERLGRSSHRSGAGLQRMIGMRLRCPQCRRSA